MWPFADVPPPPPEIFETGIAMPNPVATVIGGLLLAFGMMLLGRVILQKQSSQFRRGAMISIALFMFAVTGLMVAWSARTHAEYRQVRNGWRSNGPVPSRTLVEPSVPETPPADLPGDTTEPATDSSSSETNTDSAKDTDNAKTP